MAQSAAPTVPTTETLEQSAAWDAAFDTSADVLTDLAAEGHALAAQTPPSDPNEADASARA